MFRHKSLILAARLLFVFILSFQSVSPALAASTNKQNPYSTSTMTPTFTPGAKACSFYPIAVSVQSLQGLAIGDNLTNLYNGSQPGNFGWLSWTGDQSVPALAASLTPPGNSASYVNPNNFLDHILSTGDAVSGKTGVSNSSSVRNALDQLKTMDIDLPIWDTVTGNGSNTQYHIVNFIRVRITDYQLPGQNRISARFLGYSCDSNIPNPTTTATNTVTPSLTLTNTDLPAPTSTATPTLTTTLTTTKTPSATLTLTDTAIVAPTGTSTTTATLTPSVTNTTTATDTETSTSTLTPTATSTVADTATATITPTNTATVTVTPTATDTVTLTPTATDTSTPSLTPSATSTKTPTATLPAGINCVDLREGLNGWTQSPWTSTGAEIRQDANGIYGYAAESGTYQVGIYFQLPGGGLHKILFGGQRLTGITVAQGANAPDHTGPLAETLTANPDGSYSITATYVELRWQVNGPTDLTNQSLFTSFCYASVTPTATKTPTLTSTPACQTWNLAHDFRVAPNQENSNRDSCGNAGVWNFMQSNGVDLDPQHYTMMPNFAANAWSGTFGGFPVIAANLTSGAQVVDMHPGPSQMAVVGWRSPVDGYVSITGGVTDNDPNCGDGVTWFIYDNSTNIASGSYLNGGSQTFASGAGSAGLNAVVVKQGDMLYFDVHPRGNYICDSTRLNLTINMTVPPTPVSSICDHWDVAQDFQAAPNQANPNPDSCRNPAVWSFMGSTGLAHNPADYYLLPGFRHDNDGSIPGLDIWVGDYGDSNGQFPNIGYNTTDTTLHFAIAIAWPSHTIGLHPAPGELGVIAWRSPISGNVSIEGAVSDDDPGGGDGILWYLDKNATNLASGSYANGGLQNFAAGVGNAALSNVAVNVGDVIYLVINPNSNYLFDTTRVDLSINVVAAPLPTPTVTETAIPTNYALRFGPDVVPQDVLFPAAANLNMGQDMTVEFWIRTDSTYGGGQWHDAQWIFDKDIPGSSDPDWAVALNAGHIVSSGYNLTSTATVNDGQWHHIAITRDLTSSLTVLYIDGQQDTSSTAPPTNVSNNVALALGTEYDSPTSGLTRSLRGDLDDIRLWNVARSQAEIQANMSTRLNGSETGLAGYWPFDEGSGQVTNDQSQYHVTGQLGSSINPDAGDPTWILASELFNRVPTATPITPSPTGQTPNPTKTATAPATASATPTHMATPSPTPTQPQPLDIPGWIASPLEQSTISGVTPIKLIDSITLTDGTIDYWPVDDTSQLKVLAEHVSGNGGAILASLDTTLLANDSYIIRLQGTSSTGEQKSSGVLVTVVGEYKAGRVRFTITDLTIPLAGLPIVIGRTYDSLERNRSGDFGYGWSLAISNPRLTASQAHDVTLTMPNGKRASFYFTPTSSKFMFLHPHYTPEPGVYGSLDIEDCALIVSGGKYFCFLQPGEYQPAQYTYTDPYGRKFVMSDDGTLSSITDLNNNTLTFGLDGITSSLGSLHIPFERDTQGRITKITDPVGNEYKYGYDTAGDLKTFEMPGVLEMPGVTNPTIYTYDSHFFLNAIDSQNHTFVTNTYYPDGRLNTTKDAMDNTFAYSYDLATHTTTVTNPDLGAEVLKYDDYGKLLSQKNPLGDTTTFTYNPTTHEMLTRTDGELRTTTYEHNSNGQTTLVKDGRDRLVVSAHFNQYGGPDTITTIADGLSHTYNVSYDPTTFMPLRLNDNLGFAGGITWTTQGNILTSTNGAGEKITYHYDAYGNLDSQKDDLNPPSTFTYDILGRKLTESDPLLHKTTYTYDALGHMLTSKKDALQHSTKYTYDSNGNLIEVVDPLLRHTKYEYNYNNQVSKTIFPDLTYTTYTYDYRGNMLTKCEGGSPLHGCTNTTRYVYDLAGQLKSVTSAYGLLEASTVSYEYDKAGNKVKSFDGKMNLTQYHYDKANHVDKITDALLGETIVVYDEQGHLRSVKDARQNTTTFHYDVRGRQDLVTYQDLTTASTSYDLANRPLNMVDQAGYITHYAYDPIGRLGAVTTAYGTIEAAVTQFGYDAASRRTSITDPRSHTTIYGFDAMNRLHLITDVLEESTSISKFEYDEGGQLSSYTDANQHLITYEYDLLGRPTQANYPDGSTGKKGYDELGRLISSTDQNTKITTYGYDGLNRLTSVTNPMQQKTSYEYDPAGNLLTITDAKLHVTSFDYDVLNRQIRKTLPDPVNAGPGSAYEAYGYNAVGNRSSIRMTDGHRNTFTYNNMNRLDIASYFDPSAPPPAENAPEQVDSTVHYDYNANGLPNIVTDARGLTHYDYDKHNQLKSIILPGEQAATSVAYTYDGNGNRSTLSTAAGTTHYDYDELNHLKSVMDANQGATTYKYDELGLRKMKTLPNGVVTNYGYDDLNHLTNITESKGTSTLASYVYDVDSAGYRHSEQSTVNGQTSTIGYNYDDAYRLTEVNGTFGTVNYTYDAVGNRKTQTANGMTTTYTYNNLDQLITDGTINYGYDGRNNQTSITNGANVIHYTYDAQNRLVGAGLPGNINIANTYDAGGRKVKQVSGAQVTNFVWDEASKYGDVLLEKNASGATLASYTLGDNELLSQTRSGTTSYYLQDGQRSTRALTNAAGAITDTYSYTGFGELRSHTGTTVNPYQYTGQQFDSATGLYNLRARHYAPSLGRFLSQDTYPINLNNPAQLNRYGYAAGDPVNRFDPSGQDMVGYAITLQQDEGDIVSDTVLGLVANAAYFLICRAICGAITGQTPDDRLTVEVVRTVVWDFEIAAVSAALNEAEPMTGMAFNLFLTEKQIVESIEEMAQKPNAADMCEVAKIVAALDAARPH